MIQMNAGAFGEEIMKESFLYTENAIFKIGVLLT